MDYNDRHYMIVPFSNVTEEMVGAAMESSFRTLRHSIQGTDRVVWKYKGEKPSVFDGIDTHTHQEILAIMSGPDWSSAPIDPL